MRRDRARLLAAIGGSAATAVVGGLGARRAPTVYGRLDKPRWAPPPSAFGPVWTGLYGLMAAALYRAWRSDPARSSGLLALHGGQLVLNAAWPWAFFSLRSRAAALAAVVALDAAVATEVIVAGRRDRVAGRLLIAYLGWSLFATALTAAVGDPAAAGAVSAQPDAGVVCGDGEN
ncbi:MAG TPA: TspO/MBR family protein [Acidimicrobiales bacterium]|nr:TspO/MBR family protein [Acidimicrobiales bacterium]